MESWQMVKMAWTKAEEVKNVKEVWNIRHSIYRSKNYFKGETKERQIFKMSYGTGDNSIREVNGKNI